MDLDIARVRFHNNVGRFLYEGISDLKVGDACIVNTEEGQEYGTVICFTAAKAGETISVVRFDAEGRVIGMDERENVSRESDTDQAAKRKRAKNDPQRVYSIARKSTPEDAARYKENTAREEEAFRECKQKILDHNLNMKLISAHYFFDRAKLLFEFIAEHRVDFRELVKDLATHFKTRIELRQIGVRDEAKIVGGCGMCGRELCCNVTKGAFEAISIKMAKEQNMPLNTSKISGLCGRLMCCLYYEYETYCAIKKDLPHPGQRLLFNGTPAIIRDVNPLSRKILVETEDRRSVYVNANDVKKDEKGAMSVTLTME